MNLNQTKLVGLTMELDLKAREYKKLCDELEQLKQSNIDYNDEKLLEIKALFQKNYDEIRVLNKQIKELKENEEAKEKQTLEKYDRDNLFKTRNITNGEAKENKLVPVIKTEKNIFIRLIEKIKQIIFKK